MRIPICFGLLLAFGASCMVHAKGKLVFSAIENAANSCIAAAVLKTAYQRIGIEIEIYFTSGKRALVVSSAGSVDGETARIKAIARRHPSLVRIDVPVATLKTAIFTTVSGDRSLLTESDLPNAKVGVLTGVVRFEQMVQGYEDVWHGQSYSELFDMLNVGNLDAVLADVVAGKIMLKELGLEDIGVLEGVVRQEPLYHYLHEKNSELVPEITAVLKDMNERGEILEMIDAQIAKISVEGLRCQVD